jgi:regulatory protein
MDYLARREYGRRELRDKLIAAGFDGDIAGEAVARLAAEGLQDDGRFAAALVQSRINQGKGPVRIRQELEQRGIDAALIDDALGNCGEDWTDLARRVRGRKFGSGLPPDFPSKARQMRFLQYRGFSPDQIQAAVSPGDDL